MKLKWIPLCVVSACTATPLPDQVIPSDTLVMREFLQGPGPERTANWWGRFDTKGCWWEAHNTWLFVGDVALAESPAYPLHWNAQERAEPWFCLTEAQLAALKQIVSVTPSVATEAIYRGPTDRWTVSRRDMLQVLVLPSGSGNEWAELRDYFRVLSSVSVWGQSREESPVEIPP